MKVLSPTDTEHRLTIIPRAYPDFAFVTMALVREATDEIINIPIHTTVENGYMHIYFTYADFKEGESYSIQLGKSDNIHYRGKLFITDQPTQDYKQTKDLYIEFDG
tara:strand:- start:914 stop:1231 length:318 start_codon:yes stop_codon:yes gene_type:complete